MIPVTKSVRKKFQRLGIKCYIIDDDDINVKICCTQQQQFNFLQGRTVFMGYSFGGDPEDPVIRTSIDDPSSFSTNRFCKLHGNLSNKITVFLEVKLDILFHLLCVQVCSKLDTDAGSDCSDDDVS